MGVKEKKTEENERKIQKIISILLRRRAACLLCVLRGEIPYFISDNTLNISSVRCWEQRRVS